MGLFLLLAGITTSSAILYFASLKEKYDLSVTVNKLKLQLKNLEEERQNLFRELAANKELQAQFIKESAEFQEQISTLSSAFKTAQARVKSLTSKIRILQEENKVLSSEKEELNTKFSQVSQEKQALMSKFDSIIELKKAIRDLKQRIRLARQEIQKKMPAEEKPQPEAGWVEGGNRGFIIKDGQLTIPAYRIKIEVKPTFDTDSQ